MTSALRRFQWLYPFANIGATVAYLPLLTLVVPLKAAEIAGAGKVTLLSEVLVAGVIIATLANIAGGMASDWSRARGSTRLPWLWAGLIGSGFSYVAITVATTSKALILGVVLFQLAFNILYGPLGALLADIVPDRLKGRMSAYINLAFPLASLVTAAVGSAYFTDNVSRMWVIAMIAACLVVPLLITVPTANSEDFGEEDSAPARREAATPALTGAWQRFLNLWIARFLVQMSGTVVPSYFLFYLQQRLGDTDIGTVQSTFATILTVATVSTALLSIGLARISDRSGRRKPYMIGTIALMGCGVLLLAFGHGALPALAGYASFSMGLGAFLTIDLALVAQMLPSPQHRGRDLGFMNAANTLPAVLGPLIALVVFRYTEGAFTMLFLVLLLALAVSAGVLLANKSLR